MSAKSMRFGFGKNWEDYIKKHFSEERVEISRQHLLAFLKLDELRGKSFLDVGCGSGLHSLAALRSGAERVYSFDYDPDSVATTLKLQEFAGTPFHWEARRGSVLDKDFLRTIEPADIVYSWGVLHHTGSMWEAMDNVVPLGKEDSLYYIALYDYETHVDPTPEFWLDVKQRYNKSSIWGKRKMELWYIWKFMLYEDIRTLPQFLKRIFGYKQSRGMAFYNDVKDWLGGWPMEFAKRADVKNWAEKHDLEMITMKTGEANTEYLFRPFGNRTDLATVLENYKGTNIYAELDEVKKISMLHTDVLLLLYYFAKKGRGAILEIGPYIGGSTTAISKGVLKNQGRRKFVSVEAGGEHLSHPSLPSSDIFMDLKNNLKHYGYQDVPDLINGWSNLPNTVNAVIEKLNGEKISLLIIDADGQVERDFNIYSAHCQPGCVLVFDDYISDYAPEKQGPTNLFVDQLIRDGLVDSLGVYGWGTWFGILK